jgi:hypothetical protein
MAGVVKDAIAKRVSGDRPSPIRAAVAAAAVGAATAAITYRALRA